MFNFFEQEQCLEKVENSQFLASNLRNLFLPLFLLSRTAKTLTHTLKNFPQSKQDNYSNKILEDIGTLPPEMFGVFGSVWCKMALGEVGMSLP